MYRHIAKIVQLGSYSDQCYIQNHVVMNCVKKRSRCTSFCSVYIFQFLSFKLPLIMFHFFRHYLLTDCFFFPALLLLFHFISLSFICYCYIFYIFTASSSTTPTSPTSASQLWFDLEGMLVQNIHVTPTMHGLSTQQVGSYK